MENNPNRPARKRKVASDEPWLDAEQEVPERFREDKEQEKKREALESSYFAAFGEWELKSVGQIKELLSLDGLKEAIGIRSKELLETSYNFQNGVWRMMLAARGLNSYKFNSTLRERMLGWQDKLWGQKGLNNREEIARYVNGAFGMVTATELLCGGLVGAKRADLPVEAIRHDQWLDLYMATDLVANVDGKSWLVQIKTIRGVALEPEKVVQLVEPGKPIEYGNVEIKPYDLDKMLEVSRQFKQRGKRPVPIVMFVPAVGQHGVDQYTGFVDDEKTKAVYAKSLANLKDRVKS